MKYKKATTNVSSLDGGKSIADAAELDQTYWISSST